MHKYLLVVFFLGSALGTQWANPIDGVWSLSTLWAGGLGIPLLDAEINAIGTYTVTINAVTTLVNSLTIGSNATGSYPTLLIDGAIVTVPLINLISGKIRLINGASLIVLNQIYVAAENTNAQIEIVDGFLTEVNQIYVASGVLELLGYVNLDRPFYIDPYATLLLSGNHNVTTCLISGTGAFSLSPTAQLTLLGACDLNEAVLILLGGQIVNGVSLLSKSLKASKAEISSGVNTVLIQTTLLVSDSLILLSGTIDVTSANLAFTTTAAIQVITSSTVTIIGTVVSTIGIIVQNGALYYQNTQYQGNCTVNPGATLVFSASLLLNGIIKNAGTVIFQAGVQITADTNDVLTIIGGIVNSTAVVLIPAGTLAIQNAIVTVEYTLASTAILVLDTVVYAHGAIKGTGNAILKAVTFASTGDIILVAIANVNANLGFNVASGILVISSATVTGYANVESFGVFVLDSVIYSGIVSSQGTVVLSGTLAGLVSAIAGQAVIVGGIVSAYGNATITSGTVLIQNATVSGIQIVNAGATLALTSVIYVSGVINGAGNLIISSSLYVTGASTDIVIFGIASFINQGIINVVTGGLQFLGTSIQGNFYVNPNAALTLAGIISISANTAINGSITVLSGTLATTAGYLSVLGSVTVQGAAVIESSSANIIIEGYLLLKQNATANVKNLLTVGQTIYVNDTATLHILGGKATSAFLFLGSTATYSVDLSSTVSAVLEVLNLAYLGGNLVANIDAKISNISSILVLKYGSRSGTFNYEKSYPATPYGYQDIVDYLANYAQLDRVADATGTIYPGTSTATTSPKPISTATPLKITIPFLFAFITVLVL